MKVTAGVLAAVLAAAMFSGCTKSDNELDIIPQPAEISVGRGVYHLADGANVEVDGPSALSAAEYLVEALRQDTGLRLDTVLISPKGDSPDSFSQNGDSPDRISRRGKAAIRLSVSPFPEGEGTGSDEAGAYRLKVSGDGISIEGEDYRGLVNGIATLRQLLLSAEDPGVPYCEVADAPRFGWRGVMLDVSRHFFTAEEVKELLDVMALYKFNKFHWHLTDDEGWRVEIDEYPALTGNGAWRHFDRHDRQCMQMARELESPVMAIPLERLRISGRDTLYGGFYTKEQIREVVEYAAARGIDVVPEVDVPGHSLAAISSYPFLACSDDLSWGSIFSCPLCPGKDEVLDFYRNVFGELFELFPYEYVHIGGDEVDMSNWAVCPDCRRRMRENGLDSLPQLQSWFIGEMGKILAEGGKKMIGWDEIISGGLPEGATVMWWQNWAPGPVERVAAQGAKVIACPNSTFYVSQTQQRSSMERIYGYDDVLEDMFGGFEPVLGVQANLWAERVPTRERMFYMYFPRLMAVAELGWSSPWVKSLEAFSGRMVTHLGILARKGIPYRVPDIDGFYDVNSFIDSAQLAIGNIIPGARVFYTTDGTTPDMDSREYVSPLTVTESTDFVLRVFGPAPACIPGEIYRPRFLRQTYSPALASSPAELPAAGGGSGVSAVGASGLVVDWYYYGGESCLEIETAQYMGRYIVPDMSIPQEASGNIGLIFSGYLNVPADGIYTFRLLSDDGSLLYIDGELVADNDGGHNPVEVVCQKALAKGLHRLSARYFDHNGGLLSLTILDPQGQPLPTASTYYH